MKTYTLNKNMFYKLIVVCFLWLSLTGCETCPILVDPSALDFGDTESKLYCKFEGDYYCGWYVSAETYYDDINASPFSGNGTETVVVTIRRSVFTPGEYSDKLVIVNEKNGILITTVPITFTILGDDDDTTTTTTIPVSTSTTTEPATTSTTTTSIFVGDPPTIHSISFPSEIIGDREKNSGTVSFSDPDGDIVSVYFHLVSGYGFSDSDFDPMGGLKEGDAYDGTFEFTIWCEGSTRYMVIELTLEDQPGNMSNSETFGFTCTEVE